MIRVRILVSIASAEWSYFPGQIVDMPQAQASVWIGSGLAEAITLEPAAPAAKASRKK